MHLTTEALHRLTLKTAREVLECADYEVLTPHGGISLGVRSADRSHDDDDGWSPKARVLVTESGALEVTGPLSGPVARTLNSSAFFERVRSV